MSIKVLIDVNFEISLCVLKECAVSALATHKGNKQEKIVILCI